MSGFSGDAGDALANPALQRTSGNGMKFSTPDQDNDWNANGQCFSGTAGWWFRYCSRSCLTCGGNGKTFWNAEMEIRGWDVQFARMLVKLD